ncbi:MAG: hypothetical protein KDD53_08640, partial [Bdellovibrionales bacterium]|nr:hypothetical protein [Bdellovibrionales bacterium]
TVDVNRSIELSPKIPRSVVKVSESGLSSATTITSLKKAGFDGFLIGEAFMQHSEPHKACNKLIDEIRSLTPC